jgi:hypothetical protein
MDLNITLAKGENYLANEIDGEVVMMNIETGLYVSLNNTGKVIWDLLDTPKSIQTIIDLLVNTYKITLEQCTTDVVPFIEQMMQQEILVKNN